MSELAMFPQNKPVEIEARNPRCSMRSAKIGYVHTINLEVDEETLALLKTLPKEAELKLVMWIHDHGDSQMQTPVVEEKPAKEAKPKGEYGKAWNVLFAKGLFNIPPVRNWVQRHSQPDDKDVNDTLHRVFEVTSCSFIPINELHDELCLNITNATVEQAAAIDRIFDKAREAQNNE